MLFRSDTLLLDEPFAGLDEVSAARALALILRHQGDRTAILTAHDRAPEGFGVVRL